jgi:hypothetical protein
MPHRLKFPKRLGFLSPFRWRLAGQLAWCALFHGMSRFCGTWRCLHCYPVKHRGQLITDERQLQLAMAEEKRVVDGTADVPSSIL